MRRYLLRVHNALRLCDARIAERLEALRQDGLLEETIVFCFADHGQGIPRGKMNGIAFGYRAACVVWFPERWAHLFPWGRGTICDEPISFEDFAPTVLSLAGQPPQPHFTGRALAGAWRQAAPEAVFAARHRIDDGPDCCRSAMDGRYVYTRIYCPHLPVLKYNKYSEVADITRAIRRDHAAGRLDTVQAEMLQPTRPREYLFDLESDPWETVNLADDARHRPVLERLRAAVRERALAVRDVHFLPEVLMLARCDGRTPYEYRSDTACNPVDELLAVAELVGDPEALPRQLSLLQHAEAGVRYWAAVGLVAARQAVAPHVEQIRKHLQDLADCVAIELALALCAVTTDPEADAILCAAITGPEHLLAHQALAGLQYLPEVAPRFQAAVAASLPDLEERGAERSFPRQQAAAVHQYLFAAAPLYYPQDSAFIDVDSRVKNWP